MPHLWFSRACIVTLLVVPDVAFGTTKQLYRTTQDATTFTDIGRCQDLLNVTDDDAALLRVHAAHHAGRYTVWRQGTIVTIARGNAHRDSFVMAKDRSGRIGCISPASLSPIR